MYQYADGVLRCELARKFGGQKQNREQNSPKVTALSDNEVAQTNPNIDVDKLKASLKKSLGKLADSVHLVRRNKIVFNEKTFHYYP
ncbi:hypothetical protein [Rodentibacter haemolyticus]|uniref:Uncharacterized protein n=1 Tax=Rodentibacter haemolyticus TaxID=2778911 RepID=A0ABX6UVB9_9PAST|nr:hypothetical protein [Rodentibacter haemolyticus]QPB42005.1 hypothetical protein IHV77_08755 [Rodentibacter haemolyticus]